MSQQVMQISSEESAYLAGKLAASHITQTAFKWQLQELETHLQTCFVRGLFDAVGSIDARHVECKFASPSPELLSYIASLAGLPATVTPVPELWGANYVLRLTGTNCIDFLGWLYRDCRHLRLLAKHEEFLKLLLPAPGTCVVPKLPACRVFKVDPLAVLPSKTRESDVGYDLCVLRKHKQVLQNVALYDTGLKISVDHGLYAEIIPRSSLVKSGYMLANSIGIIDRSYTGNLLVALAKVSPDAPEIEFPFKCCQLVFRQQVHVHMMEAQDGAAPDATARGEGGFGSTNKSTQDRHEEEEGRSELEESWRNWRGLESTYSQKST